MSIAQVACPECGAKLSSKAGFTAGQKIKCPKCEEVFAVPAAKRTPPVELEIDDEDERPTPKKKKPAVVEDEEDDEEPRPAKKKKPVVVDDDDDEEVARPKKKKKKGKKSDDEGSYTTSPLRFIILGVLLIVMGVLGYFLIKKINAPPEEIIVPNRLDQDSAGPAGPAAGPPPRQDGEPAYLGEKLPKDQIPAAKAKALQLIGKWKLKEPVPGRTFSMEFLDAGSARRVVDHGSLGGYPSTNKQITWQITGVKGNVVDVTLREQAGNTTSFSLTYTSLWLGTAGDGKPELRLGAYQVDLTPFKSNERDPDPSAARFDVVLVKE